MVYKLLVNLPLIGATVEILNAYAFDGDARATQEFAGAAQWVRAFGVNTFVALGLALLCSPGLTNELLYLAQLEYGLTYSIDVSIGELATSVLPNVLGFGIGVYALVFAIEGSLLRKIQDGCRTSKRGSVLLLNADMAAPLLALLAAVVSGIVAKILPGVPGTQVVAWFFFWGALLFTLELLHTLYALGENAIIHAVCEDAQGAPGPDQREGPSE